MIGIGRNAVGAFRGNWGSCKAWVFSLPVCFSHLKNFKKEKVWPWLMWFSGLSTSPQTGTHRFVSQSGHIPALWARSPVGGVQEATN